MIRAVYDQILSWLFPVPKTLYEQRRESWR
jgi:hypothetical protein